MSVKGGSRSTLPTISNPQLSYSQRYEHMTKLANYNEMNETQIWKEYEKLRACLKELNEEVLYHMEKKAFSNLNKGEKAKPTKDLEGTLVLLDDEKKSNDTRLQNYSIEFSRLDERIKFLAAKPNLLDEMTREGSHLQSRIKQIRKDNKDLKRNAELQGRDLINNTSILDKLMIEEQKLTRMFKTHRKHEETIRIVTEKIEAFREKIVELQRAIDLRMEQFARQENFIAEEIHFEHYSELRKQKEAIQKYEPIYKRNYLMKLKDLEALVNSIAKHDKVIQETEASILTMRSETEAISSLVGAQRKRYHSSLLPSRKPERPEQPHNETLPVVLANPAPTPTSNDKNERIG